jgi:hypothetical protein
LSTIRAAIPEKIGSGDLIDKLGSLADIATDSGLIDAAALGDRPTGICRL